MRHKLKPLDQQVIVITGASSGIGLSTARMAAKRGAKLVLAARSDDALRELVKEIQKAGGRAVEVEVDVGSEAQVRRIADAAEREFGGFDTWVNNAGVSIYGESLDVATEDMRRLFDTNFWGVVYGSRIAVEHLRRRGGALINVGSQTSDKAAPLQAIYSASKQAVKGWTDALRMELEHQKAPVSVTLVKPGPIDTPYTMHAKNYMPDQPKHVAPVYTPGSVAAAILYAATTPVRDLYVGSIARMTPAMDYWAPRLSDKAFGSALISGTHSGRPRNEHEALYKAGGELKERGDYPGMARPSISSGASMHPVMAAAAAAGIGLIATALWRSAGNGEKHHREPREVWAELEEKRTATVTPPQL
ncbi:MAG TPA: SDR family oxidoreductase [Vicinamibacterales bacterium]|nr:SDR family oxidoreductase [Vicinamibacterales bacterium]